jgi:hypothetical protein
MANRDLVALYKLRFDNELAIAYENSGALRKLITVGGSDVTGSGVVIPLIGGVTTQRRYGNEYITPIQKLTSKVTMEFESYEVSEGLSYQEQDKIDNPNYIPTTVRLINDGITQRIEQIISNAFNNIPVIDSNVISYDNIENGYRINGDGTAYTNAGGETELTLKGLFKIKEILDNMGVANSERIFYVHPNAWYGLLLGADSQKMTSIDYTDDKVLSIPGMQYSNFLGMNIVVSQFNPNGGLPASGAGHYAYVFCRDTVLANIKIGDAGKTMWNDDNTRQWVFYNMVKMGAVGQAPTKFIKVACKTV